MYVSEKPRRFSHSNTIFNSHLELARMKPGGVNPRLRRRGVNFQIVEYHNWERIRWQESYSIPISKRPTLGFFFFQIITSTTEEKINHPRPHKRKKKKLGIRIHEKLIHLAKSACNNLFGREGGKSCFQSFLYGSLVVFNQNAVQVAVVVVILESTEMHIMNEHRFDSMLPQLEQTSSFQPLLAFETLIMNSKFIKCLIRSQSHVIPFTRPPPDRLEWLDMK